ncbi:hypothetical protein AFB00_09695 [Pseudonocardia sp. HH130630-07]|nr:hypothetical protein AFB00_09695 [Pseudonocardia sp. HH130630-07]
MELQPRVTRPKLHECRSGSPAHAALMEHEHGETRLKLHECDEGEGRRRGRPAVPDRAGSGADG